VQATASSRSRSLPAIALGGSVILTAAFGMLLTSGADGIAFVPVIVGIVGATFLMLTRRMPSLGQLVLWWIGGAAVGLFTTAVTWSAVDERRSMADQDSCVLRPLDFENDSVATLRVEWWPPRAQCRYGYSYQGVQEVVWESRWWIYWPVAFVPLSGLLLAGATRQTWRRHQSLRSEPRSAAR
jgi:hypothetical protein